MDNKLICAWVIKNSICVICWTVLAIVFNAWWIALFGLLFMSDLQTNYKQYRVCDGCGKHGPPADSHNEAIDNAKKAGWIHYVEGNLDYCPDCKREIKQ